MYHITGNSYFHFNPYTLVIIDQFKGVKGFETYRGRTGKDKEIT